MAQKGKVVILQPNYIPWKGYFDLIAGCDLFIIYDDVQFTKNDWRNRNRIKTPKGAEWLTIPVVGGLGQLINEVLIADPRWQLKHWKTLQANYARARFSREIFELLEPVYLGEAFSNLVAANVRFIEVVCSYLGITTKIQLSSNYPRRSSGSNGVLELCMLVGSTCYVSGPAGRKYLVEDDFSRAGIEVCWFDYAGYREYSQLWGAFEHHVSILDMLFNCGKQSRCFMKNLNL